MQRILANRLEVRESATQRLAMRDGNYIAEGQRENESRIRSFVCVVATLLIAALLIAALLIAAPLSTHRYSRSTVGRRGCERLAGLPCLTAVLSLHCTSRFELKSSRSCQSRPKASGSARAFLQQQVSEYHGYHKHRGYHKYHGYHAPGLHTSRAVNCCLATHALLAHNYLGDTCVLNGRVRSVGHADLRRSRAR